MEEEDQRDGDTWGMNLLEAVERGFNPKQIIADNAKGIEAGSKIACPNALYCKDNFHITKDLMDLKRYFGNQLKRAEQEFLKQENNMAKAKAKKRGNKLSTKYNLALKELDLHQYLFDNISTLIAWFRFDVIYKSGSDPVERNELYDFILEEFKNLSKLHPHRLKDICSSLDYQKKELLSFTTRMEKQFIKIADEFKCSLTTIWQICELQKYGYGSLKYQKIIKQMYDKFGERYYALNSAVKEVMDSITSSSSLVENFNSRLSGRFFIHKFIGNEYLELLRFYLNHVPFLRSSDPKRKGRTPAAIMRGERHLHWLEMLGLSPFKRLVA
ncbi:MAG: hypothetical protein GY793_08895 [Proteobacteria bacterium]|nr:hypothetical protein [Pseudomonadota bacterium]